MDVVKISQDVGFYLTKQISFWMRQLTTGQKFKDLRVLFVQSAAVRSSSFHAPDLCGPRWTADGSHRDPARHQCSGQALRNHGLDMVGVTLE